MNMKTLKMKVQPYTNEEDHLELIRCPKEQENWSQALINDDNQSIESILSKCSSEEKNNYLNGCFEVSENEKISVKSRCPIGLKEREPTESFSHSLHMAVAFGSHQAVKSLIKHECNVFVTNTNGRNAVHCLIYVSFMRVDIEDEMIEMFRTIKQNVSPITLRDLLMQEDDCGCRPAEYAIHLGVFSIATEILCTNGIFLTSIEYHSRGETRWFEITDYEESRDRMSRSPVVLLALVGKNKLDDQHFCRGAIIRKAFVCPWCRRGLLAYVYSGVSLTMNECLSGGNSSYIVRLSVRDLHGPTSLFLCQIEPVLACA